VPRLGCCAPRRHDGRVALTPCSDVSAAGWIMAGDRLWHELVGFGPDDCFFCLWDGWGQDIQGGDGARVLDWHRGTVRQGPRIAPAFPPSVLNGPKVVVPNRAYFLFHGAVSDLGDWGPAEMWPEQSRLDMPDPAFIWPADHAWCVTNDVDPHWAGVGADVSAIDELLGDPRLDVVPADPREDQPWYR
jgi:hypothetical protein